MAYIEWNEDLSVGVDLFNEDHKRLFEYINRLHQGMVTGLGTSSMTDILNGLVDYTMTHFDNEERMMIQHTYAGYEAHKKEHDTLVARVADFQTQLNSGRGSFSLALMGFLKDWLINHIMGTDLKYKDFFLEKGVK